MTQTFSRSFSDMQEEERAGPILAKAIARSGLCSRREAINIIKAGDVEVNGNVVTSCSTWLSVTDVVKVYGKEIDPHTPPQIILFHKPKGYLTTKSDPLSRPTIYDLLPQDEFWQNISPVGRLDFSTEGLLVLTNDGEIKRFLELPANNIEREYRVRVHGPRVSDQQLEQLARGLSVAGVQYKGIDARFDDPRFEDREPKNQSNRWIAMVLREGKNREIRRVIESFGWEVTRLIRVKYGMFRLGMLQAGEVKPCPQRDLQQMQMLMDKAYFNGKNKTRR
ncbi:hypothetical protein GUITHDRAFT_105005 [Guillardia theta CCMP2712]|uniref:RNA-binding S4 domain-containing protein n=1 Tax=Guillardia theta (strain CCMP2712) TaxID=905079 RepID=L1JM42_GUITC|nr:hypothetical protein GUITHDRAFT_105005 [Guillardia theta CCMP2712]EKX49477.1 hypothetical protein GUITHDRAFT_105005 [Guillardia theta CCMP2712]|eukprot:XP_005836457.1 hypothetical protein GUITHDRAFT_105005 [Guillardia theta CCMP2712]